MASSITNVSNSAATPPSQFVRQLGDTLVPVEEKCFQAILDGNAHMLQELVKTHDDTLDFTKRNAHGYTFLQAAVFSRQLEMVAILLKTGRCDPIDDGMNAAVAIGNSSMVDLFLKYIRAKKSKRSFKRMPSATSIKANNRNTGYAARNVIHEESLYECDDLVTDAISISGSLPASTDPSMDSDPAVKHYGRSNSCPYISDSELSLKPKQQNAELNLESHLPIVGKEHILRRAASAENFKVTEALIYAGVQLSEPQYLHCDSGDSLQDATDRLHTYRALASATYMALTAEDPIIVAFERSQRLKELSTTHPEHKDEFQQLARRASLFAVELMSLCQSSEEVEKLLLLHDPSSSPIVTKFGRLQLAVRFKQKEFIAHPNCQEVVSSLWSDGTNSWKQWSYPRRVVHIVIQAMLLVIMSLLAIFAPNCRLANPAFVPLNRFIYSASMYVVFLGCIVTFLMTDSDIALCAVIAFVIGSCVRLFAMDIPIQGLRHFFNRFWNQYDVCMYAIFLSAFLCFLITKITSIFIQVEGEGLFAVAAILAICRVLQWFHLHQRLGPLIIAFSKIVGVVLKLSMICFVLFAAFAINIHYVFRNTNNNSTESVKFSSFDTTLSTHFWALYGHGELQQDEREWKESYLQNLSPAEMASVAASLKTTEFIGSLLWGLFHVVSVIILLNMLIAMMTDTFQRVQTNCDVEWKFARTVLWLYYFEDCNTVPSPFNIMAVIKGYIIWFAQIVSCAKKTPKTRGRQGSGLNWSLMRKAVANGTGGIHLKLRKLSEADADKLKKQYANLIKQLIQRYLQKRDLERQSDDLPKPS